MNTDHPRFEEYMTRFESVAAMASVELEGPQPEIASAEHHLCLFGENGLEPDEEFALLAQLEVFAQDKTNSKTLKKTTVTTPIWEDIILYIA